MMCFHVWKGQISNYVTQLGGGFFFSVLPGHKCKGIEVLQGSGGGGGGGRMGRVLKTLCFNY